MNKPKFETKKCKVCNDKKNIAYFKINRKCKDGHVDICNQCIKDKRSKNVKNVKKNYYVYKFLDINDEVIYVGQTTNIKSRMLQHKLNNYTNFDMYSNIYKIRYVEVESDYHMNIYEIHYICKYDPKYNIQYKTINKNLFDLPELKWEVYILNDFIKNTEFSCTVRTGKVFKIRTDFINSEYFKHECIPEYEKLLNITDNYFEETNQINTVNEYFNPYIMPDYFENYDSHFSKEDII